MWSRIYLECNTRSSKLAWRHRFSFLNRKAMIVTMIVSRGSGWTLSRWCGLYKQLRGVWGYQLQQPVLKYPSPHEMLCMSEERNLAIIRVVCPTDNCPQRRSFFHWFSWTFSSTIFASFFLHYDNIIVHQSFLEYYQRTSVNWQV